MVGARTSAVRATVGEGATRAPGRAGEGECRRREMIVRATVMEGADGAQAMTARSARGGHRGRERSEGAGFGNFS